MPEENVSDFIGKILAGLTSTLEGRIVGVYLYGSLALGDFDPQSSDVDILVATKESLSPEGFRELGKMHAQIQDEGGVWAHRLEAAYVPVAALRKYDPAHNHHPLISPVCPFDMVDFGPDWVLNAFIIREKGVTLAGPSPAELIDVITADDIRKIVRNLLHRQWSKHLTSFEWMHPRKYQAFTVLTVCRMLHSIETGDVVSKPQAAAWALRKLQPQWRTLIERSLAQKADPTPSDPADALEFLSFAIELTKSE